MKDPNPTPLLQVNPQSRTYLSEITRWSRFLAITGFVFCGLTVLTGLFFVLLIAFQPGSSGSEMSAGAVLSSAGKLVIFVLFAMLYFYPCLFLYRFARETNIALKENDKEALSDGFANLKSTFRYVGVLTLAFLSFYLLAIIFYIGTVVFSHPTHIGGANG